MMRQVIVPITVILAILLGTATPGLSRGYSFAYRLKPGQVWIGVRQSETIRKTMGNKKSRRSHQTIEYKVLKGPKAGWVTLKARILKTSAPIGRGMDWRKATFSAIMHSSGELRRVTASGPMPPPRPNVSPQFREMEKQGYQMILDAWKAGIFWFPEFPPERLHPGDEFDLNRKWALGSTKTTAVQTVAKERYILDDVADGLAYFLVKDRSITRTKGAMGSGTNTRSGGKGDAIFDMKTGMWAEFLGKRKMNTTIGGNIPMMQGAQSESYTIHRIRMELQ